MELIIKEGAQLRVECNVDGIHITYFVMAEKMSGSFSFTPYLLYTVYYKKLVIRK